MQSMNFRKSKRNQSKITAIDALLSRKKEKNSIA
jgi:hypothetical protein